MATSEDDTNPFAAPESDLEPGNFAAASRKGFEYANFGVRFVAAFIDGIITQILGFIVGIGVGLAGVGMGLEQDAIQIVGGLFGLILGWLYSALQESSEAQATLGKRAMGIIVVDMAGDRISFGRATGRHFSKIPSGMICLIGYFMQPFTEKKQALHDIMAGTLVVKA